MGIFCSAAVAITDSYLTYMWRRAGRGKEESFSREMPPDPPPRILADSLRTEWSLGRLRSARARNSCPLISIVEALFMATPQAPIGSGFGAASTGAEVIAGRDLTGKLLS
jgi:hypothetical protein